MNFGELALKVGLTKEELALLLIQAALITLTISLGSGTAGPNCKVPL